MTHGTDDHGNGTTPRVTASSPTLESRPDGEGPGSSFVIELAHFSGPLDLLLTLLREEQIDIYDIPIARIAEQFVARIRSLRLDEAADYLEMAARLLRIKAQMLLPRHDGEEAWDDPRAELVRRLLEYQQVREVVDVLEARAEARRGRFTHPVPPAPARPVTGGPLAADLLDLLAAVDRVLRTAQRPTMHAVVPRALDVAGALEATRALLARRPHVRWSELVGPRPEPWQVLSLLLALLEMARLGECVLRQPAPFGRVEIDRQQASASDAVASSPDGRLPVADRLDDRPSPPDGPPPANSGDGFVAPTEIGLDSAHDPAGAAA